MNKSDSYLKNKGVSLIWLFLLFTTSLFFLSKYQNGDPLAWLTLSQFSSLLGVTLLTVSFILSSRWSWLENLFGGLDKVYKQHHLTGGISFVLLLHHPLFLILDALPDFSYSWKYLWLSEQLPYNWGILSLYTLAFILIFTLLINLPYSLWKKLHEYMGVSLIFASFHILTISSDVSSFMPLRFWIIFLLSIALFAAFYRRFLYGYFGPKYLYSVKSIHQIKNIFAVDLLPVGKAIKFHPGQFVFCQFSLLGEESHPFSIAIGPDKKYLRLVIKNLGDYTNRLDRVSVGSRVNLWGPYGQFGEVALRKKDLVWIAGGIGITPFLSLLDHEISQSLPRKINLIYSVRRSDEAVFDREILEKTKSLSNITYTKHVSQESGRITAAKIIKIVGDLTNKKIMICGPISMMESLTSELKKSGVKNQNIIYEDFNLKP